MIVPNYFPKKNNFFPKNFIVFVKYSIFPNYFPKKINHFPKQLYIIIFSNRITKQNITNILFFFFLRNLNIIKTFFMKYNIVESDFAILI